MVSADKDVRLGLILLDCKRTCDLFPGTPFPFVFNPPEPPDDPGEASQTQVLKKKPHDEFQITRFCKHCGAPLEEVMSICPNCNKKN
jgi:hypothetical protein